VSGNNGNSLEIARKRLLEIVDLQTEVEFLLRFDPSGSLDRAHTSSEGLQRKIAITAIRSILFEPRGTVPYEEDFLSATEQMLPVLVAQLESLRDDPAGS